MYDDGSGTGRMRSVHVDTERARETLMRIGRLLGQGLGRDRVEGKGEGKWEGEGEEEVEVEVIVAHDAAWREKNRGRFWPGQL